MSNLDVHEPAVPATEIRRGSRATDRVGMGLGPARLAIVLTVLAIGVLGVAGLVNALLLFDRRADDNSSLAYLDLVYGHGYQVHGKSPPALFSDREVVEYAKAAMPPAARYRVVVGQRWKPLWTSKWSSGLEADFLLFHLLPRHQTPTARWVFCFSCDMPSRGELEVLVVGRGGLSFGRART